jgi:L-ascorbate metabolism protein UlaG (beta-lactamase superfamily)
MIKRIHWLGHASFRINGPPHSDGPVIYIDPWQLPPDSPPADFILVSHDHHDHCSPEDVNRIRHLDTMVVANPRAAQQLGPGVNVLRPWQMAASIHDVLVRAVPAYTINKAYHAKSYDALGFIISIRKWDIYFAGDTDLIPEMDKISCDVALLPVGGVFTMDYVEAAELTNRLRPRYAIPMHYGSEVSGSAENGRRFCELVADGIQALELTNENTTTVSSYW